MREFVVHDNRGVFRTPLLLQLLGAWIHLSDGDTERFKDGDPDLSIIYETVLCNQFPKYFFSKSVPGLPEWYKRKVRKSWLECLEKVARHRGTFSEDELETDSLPERPHVKEMGLIEPRDIFGNSHGFVHESFCEFFHARWWSRQSEDVVLSTFAELFEPEAGFYSALSLRFFCEIQHRGNNTLMQEIADQLIVSHRDKDLCLNLVKQDQHVLLDAVCLALIRSFGKDEATIYINAPNGTPLQYACSHGMLALAELLVDRGASPDICNSDGDTALALAAAEGHLSVVKLLVCKGKANVNASGGRPLKNAVRKVSKYDRRSLETVDFLLDSGAHDASLALREACKMYPVEFDFIKHLVLERKAEIQQLGEDGKSALDQLDKNEKYSRDEASAASELMREYDDLNDADAIKRVSDWLRGQGREA